ncbi:372_t:CDS:2 [Dentiscutata heterogama]|uniref:372_t:CDS:1 n=1 Tax=Dentiscutata heterogama TaxID=1316150 RepID=A0ACA9KBF5_9GLOM|nr:372_t:CDS:2 [Dentiscutata heterogama]
MLSKKKRTPKLLELYPENKELKSLKRDIKTTEKCCRKLKKLANLRETTTDREDSTDKLKTQDEKEKTNTRTELKL